MENLAHSASFHSDVNSAPSKPGIKHLAFAVDSFCDHVFDVLRELGPDAEGWTGTTLPSRMSSLIQRFADGHFPLPFERARRMLMILDLLIDLGDRRSTALQQSETFRSLQRR